MESMCGSLRSGQDVVHLSSGRRRKFSDFVSDAELNSLVPGNVDIVVR